VRAEYTDRQLPWATGLFEIKEHWVALAAMILATWGLTFWKWPLPESGWPVRLAGWLSLTLALAVCFALLVGLTLVSLRSVH
jgi:hypothetical protein